MMPIRRASLLLLLLAACAADGSAAQSPSKGSKGPAAASTAPTNAASSALSTTNTTSTTAPAAPPPLPPSTKHEEPSAVFDRIKAAITKCYETGRASTPTMIDGKLTLNASVESSGKINCVIPTDDSGLTQEVEDCMSSKLAAISLDSSATPWQIAVPVQVKGGSIQPGTLSSSAASSGIESVETHRMPDAFDALEGLVPDLQTCLRDVDRSSGTKQVIIGARVNTDGRTACALATGGVPPKVSECAAQLFVKTKFPPPKGGMGLILVPITLTKR